MWHLVEATKDRMIKGRTTKGRKQQKVEQQKIECDNLKKAFFLIQFS